MDEPTFATDWIVEIDRTTRASDINAIAAERLGVAFDSFRLIMNSNGEGKIFNNFLIIL